MTILALDLGKFKTVACIYTPGCDEHRFVTLPTCPQAFHDLLVEHRPDRVVIEACSIMGWVADLAEGLGIPIQVVNTNDERWSWKKVKRKTDRDDALKLARLSTMDQLDLVHVPNRGVRQWRSLIAHRHKLKDERTAVKNAIRALLDTQAIGWPSGGKGWTNDAIEMLEGMSRDLMDCSMDDLWRGQLGIYLRQLKMLERLMEQVEAKLGHIAASNPQVQRLCQMPNVSTRTAEVLVAHIDDPHRFKNARQVSCYAGLTPRQFQSGIANRQGRISKRGPAVMRRVLLQVSWGMTRQCPEAKAVFDRISGGQTSQKKKAAVAVGRKILTCAWAMMRDESEWDPRKMTHLLPPPDAERVAA